MVDRKTPLSKSIIKKQESLSQVIEFIPPNLRAEITETARDFFVKSEAKKNDFRLSDLVAKRTGIANLERVQLEEKVEEKALIKLKEMQEVAYKQAYDLGLNEGRDRALSESTEEIKNRLKKFDQLIDSIDKLKSILITQNESHIMRLIFELTKRLTLITIEENKDRILPILKEAIELAQTEENITVRLSEEDYNFIEGMKETAGKDLNFVKKLKLEKSTEVLAGGCVVETNYGIIDATVTQRIEKLWKTFEEKLPKVKDNLKS